MFSVGASAEMCWLTEKKLKFVGWQKTIFGAYAWDSRFQRMYIQMFGESQFCKASFLAGLPPKYACLQKIICWATVWDCGLQRTHIQIFSESQFYNASFLLGLPLKCDRLGKIIF